jgi:hypothetical protein
MANSKPMGLSQPVYSKQEDEIILNTPDMNHAKLKIERLGIHGRSVTALEQRRKKLMKKNLLRKSGIERMANRWTEEEDYELLGHLSAKEAV